MLFSCITIIYYCVKLGSFALFEQAMQEFGNNNYCTVYSLIFRYNFNLKTLEFLLIAYQNFISVLELCDTS